MSSDCWGCWAVGEGLLGEGLRRLGEGLLGEELRRVGEGWAGCIGSRLEDGLVLADPRDISLLSKQHIRSYSGVITGTYIEYSGFACLV